MAAPDPLPTELAAALAHNHYDRRWLDFGVLTPERALEQAKVPWNLPDDPHTEYQRWETFDRYVDAQSAFADEQIRNLLTLLDIDPEKEVLYRARLWLLRHPGITDDQFEFLARTPALAKFTKGVLRARVARRMNKGEWSPELVDECIASGDKHIMRWLMEHPKLDRPTLLAVAERCTIKAIRKQAAHLLHSRRFHVPPE